MVHSHTLYMHCTLYNDIQIAAISTTIERHIAFGTRAWYDVGTGS
jgi:hypothetical protein